jgi:hypothetical protein
VRLLGVRSLLLALVLVIGCDMGEKPVPTQVAHDDPLATVGAMRFEATLLQVLYFKERCGACASARCTKQLSDEMTAWSTANAPESGKPYTLSPPQAQRMNAVIQAMMECWMRATAAGYAGDRS